MAEEPLRIPTAEEIDAAAVIDSAALKRWFQLDPHRDVVMNVTRTELDFLLLGLRNLLFAQTDTLRSLQLLSHEQPDEANLHFGRALQRNTKAIEQITAFTGHLMRRATQDV